MRIYSSKDLQLSNVLKNSKETVLFAHAFSGSDTTSAFFGKGKLQTINLLNSETNLQEVVKTFNKPNATKEDITGAGEIFTLALYKAEKNETSVNHQRYVLFNTSVGHSSQAVTLARLPPTFAALQQHSLRVYHQIQAWHGNVLEPEEWGWKKSGDILIPLLTTEAPAPLSILKLISCACKKGCGKRCGCFKVGLRCSLMCMNCHGQGCFNADRTDESELEQE